VAISNFARASLVICVFALPARAVDLNAPAAKKVTVASEIKRGHDSVHKCSSAPVVGFLNLLKCLQMAFDLNQQANTDTDPFLLGANFGSWVILNMNLTVMHDSAKESEFNLAENAARQYFKDFRNLQFRLKIDDETLVSQVLKMNFASVQKDISAWDRFIKSGVRPYVLQPIKIPPKKPDIYSLSRQIEGFAGLKWGTSKEKVQGLNPHPPIEPARNVDFYTREGDPTILDKIPIEKTVYGFWKGKLISVRLFVRGKENCTNFKIMTFGAFGTATPIPNMKNTYAWTNPLSSMLLSFDDTFSSALLIMVSKKLLDMKLVEDGVGKN